MGLREHLSASVDQRVAETAARQLGLITRRQALALGLSVEMIRTRLRRGLFIRVFPGVYRLQGAPESWRQSVLAAVFWGGEEAIASHGTAAKLWGFPVASDVIDITTPKKKDAPDGVCAHRGKIASRARVRNIPVTTVPRTLMDIASRVPPSTLELMVDDAITRRLTSRAQLEWELSMSGGKGRPGSAQYRNAIEHLSSGHCESALETKVLRILLAADLPMPVRQHEVRSGDFVARLDLAYAEAKVAIEVDGFAHHSSRAAFDADRRRDALLRSLGWQVIRVSSQLLRDPAPFLDAVRAALGCSLF